MTIIEAVARYAPDERRGRILLADFYLFVAGSLTETEEQAWWCEYAELAGPTRERLDDGRCRLSGSKDGATEVTTFAPEWVADLRLNPLKDRGKHANGVIVHGVRITDSADAEPAPDPVSPEAAWVAGYMKRKGSRASENDVWADYDFKKRPGGFKQRAIVGALLDHPDYHKRDVGQGGSLATRTESSAKAPQKLMK